ncbi:hypothetical protein YC2023_036707 [Brassica napus]
MFSSCVKSKFVSFLGSYQFFGHDFEAIQEWICDVSATSPLQAIVPRVLLLETMWCVQLALCGCWSYTLCTSYAWRADLFGYSSEMELRFYDMEVVRSCMLHTEELWDIRTERFLATISMVKDDGQHGLQDLPVIAEPPSCSSRRDEAVDTNHASIGARTKPHAPPEVSPLRAREVHAPPPENVATAGPPSPAAGIPPSPPTTAAGIPPSPPVTDTGDSPATRSTRPSQLRESTRLTRLTDRGLTFPKTLTSSVFDRSKGVLTQNFDLISDMESI